MNNKNRLIEIISIIKINNLMDDRSPKNLRKTIEDLGPTFIKIGHILSTRVDLTFCSKKSLTSKVGDELRLLMLGEY